MHWAFLVSTEETNLGSMLFIFFWEVFTIAKRHFRKNVWQKIFEGFGVHSTHTYSERLTFMRLSGK
ncbi:MAG: hypothetical protein M0Q13_11205, partial [Methanothrix sp.]|nr:hypothetical protein [Methanothrix sp.]